MARLFVCDSEGAITLDLEACGPFLNAALEDEQAEPIVRCAVLMGLSALVQGGRWPTALLEMMAEFMARMKDQMSAEQLM